MFYRLGGIVNRTASLRNKPVELLIATGVPTVHYQAVLDSFHQKAIVIYLNIFGIEMT